MAAPGSIPPVIPGAFVIEASAFTILTPAQLQDAVVSSGNGCWGDPAAEAAVRSVEELARAEYEAEEEEDEDGEFFDELARKSNCDAIRRKIQRFLAQKTMTQTAFLRAIDANSNSYRRFMRYKGAYRGSDNSTYSGALYFFHREAKKAKAAPRGAKSKSKDKGASAAKAAPKVSRAQQKADMEAFVARVEAITLPEPVYVFDDCDDVRKKINEVIAAKTLTQAALLKALDVNSNSLRRFLTTKGKREGSSNGVYYAAYCFFEKLRIAEGKDKTKKRTKNECELPMGYALTRDPTHSWGFVGK